MFLADPPPSQGDLHFRCFGFPVRVHPFFWVVAVLMGIRLADPVRVLIWVVVMFLSILVHELGHAFAIRYYGGHARIALYAFGGLAIEENAHRTSAQQIIISLAGPIAGFLLAGFIIAIIQASGHPAGFATSLENVTIDTFYPMSFLGLGYYCFEPFSIDVVNFLVLDLLFINIFWGILNLLPVYPLDGGQIAREFFVQKDPWKGIVHSLWLSIFTAGAIAVAGLVLMGSQYMAFMFGYMAYINWTTLQQYLGSRGRPW